MWWESSLQTVAWKEMPPDLKAAKTATITIRGVRCVNAGSMQCGDLPILKVVIATRVVVLLCCIQGYFSEVKRPYASKNGRSIVKIIKKLKFCKTKILSGSCLTTLTLI